MKSPIFLLPYDVLIAAGFCIIFASRQIAKYQIIRLFVYGLLLGGALGQILVLIPWRS
jgi:hypothetical protein